MNFLKGKFLSTNALLGVLNSATETLTEIPRTVKENVYFVLDHSSNISKKTNNTRMDHWDNCGIWETTSTSLKTTYFVRQENGTLKFCDKKKDGKFYREVRKKMALLDPQPNETNLVEMKRYYAKLQRDPKYEKRISWFEKLPGYSPEVLSRAVAEYLGKFLIEEKSRHRNSKKTNQEYVRSSPATKNKIRSDLESGKTVKQTFSDIFSLWNTSRATLNLSKIWNIILIKPKTRETNRMRRTILSMS